VRLGVYADLVFWNDGHAVSTDRAFIKFVAALGSHLDQLTVFGRLAPEQKRSHYVLPSDIRFVALPYYPTFRSGVSLVGSLRAASRIFAAELEDLDAAWLFGPHPVSFAFARIARRRGKPVFLGVRQDFPKYIGKQLPSRWWIGAVPAAHLLEWGYRRLARVAPAIVVGEELAARYRNPRAPTLAVNFSLIKSRDIADEESALGRSWDEEIRILTVGRLDAEKNPLLLPTILARLVERGGSWRFVVVGDGPLASDVASRAAELGVDGRLDLLGYQPFGPDLWGVYRSCHGFLHVSRTEGVPQVLFEAFATGLPTVATDVGGVAAAVANGSRALLIPAEDANAAADALERLRNDVQLREELIRAGLEYARQTSVLSEVGRVNDFLRLGLQQRARVR
jgi:glycosyltransferase involved in cell wall biosynthesis